MAANLDLYNGFWLRGQIWTCFIENQVWVTNIFLGTVMVAGLYGALVVHRKIFFVQALPVLIALLLIIVRKKNIKKIGFCILNIDVQTLKAFHMYGMGNNTLKYLVITIAGTFFSILLFLRINNGQVLKNEMILSNAIAKSELKLQDELQKINLVIKSLSFFFEKKGIDISQEEFERFTDPFKDKLKGLKSLGWAPNVLESEKKKFIKNISDFSKITIKETDGSNALIGSAVKKLYYPLTIINPYKQLQGILGYDLYSNSIRKMAIARSTSCREIAFTGPVELVHGNNDVPGFLAIKSVFEPNGFEVKGIVIMAYHMDKFLSKTLGDEMNVLDLEVKDQYANNARLFTSAKGLGETADKEPIKSLRISAAGRIWHIDFYPKGEYAEYPTTLESYLILILGLLLTFLIIKNLKGMDDRDKILENQVLLRTKDLKESNSLLKTSNRQKENLLREIHHRVMNNLQITSSLMNLQKRKLRDQNAIYALSSSQDRINAIALIHQKIYQHDGGEAVNLKGYLENLIKSHKRISPNARYIIDCPEIYIDLDTAVPLAIITFEIVTNALKHAFSNESELNLLHIVVASSYDDIINISISDNGVGLPDQKDNNKKTGLGQDIIKKLCRQLAAEYEYSSSRSGTVFRLRFKQRKLKMPVFA